MVRVVIVEDQKIMQKYFEYIILKNPEFSLLAGGYVVVRKRKKEEI